jgi:hypothetical protein
MTSSFEIFGNTYIYPKLNILQIKHETGKQKLYNVDFFKWYFLSSIFFSFYFSKKIYNKIKLYLQIVYANLFKRKKIIDSNEKKFIIIFGFGDSSASILFTNNLINSAFYLILLNSQKNLEFREKFNLNKFEDLKNLCLYSKSKSESGIGLHLKKDFLISYEDLIKNPKILEDKISKDKIYLIIDFTSFRIKSKSQEEIENNDNKNICSNSNRNTDPNKDNNNDNNKNKDYDIIDIKKNEERKKHYNMESLYYNGALNFYIKNYMDIFDNLFKYFDNTKILLFDYVDKRSDMNHKLLFDLKSAYLKNLEDINAKNLNLNLDIFNFYLNFILKIKENNKENINYNNQRKGFIHYVKNIYGKVNYKYNQFNNSDVEKILKYLEIIDYTYNFS